MVSDIHSISTRHPLSGTFECPHDAAFVAIEAIESDTIGGGLVGRSNGAQCLRRGCSDTVSVGAPEKRATLVNLLDSVQSWFHLESKCHFVNQNEHHCFKCTLASCLWLASHQPMKERFCFSISGHIQIEL